jgi:hypothetical protein
MRSGVNEPPLLPLLPPCAMTLGCDNGGATRCPMIFRSSLRPLKSRFSRPSSGSAPARSAAPSITSSVRMRRSASSAAAWNNWRKTAMPTSTPSPPSPSVSGTSPCLASEVIRGNEARCHGWVPLPAAAPTLGARPGGPACGEHGARSAEHEADGAWDGMEAWRPWARGVERGHPVLEAGEAWRGGCGAMGLAATGEEDERRRSAGVWERCGYRGACACRRARRAAPRHREDPRVGDAGATSEATAVSGCAGNECVCVVPAGD